MLPVTLQQAGVWGSGQFVSRAGNASVCLFCCPDEYLVRLISEWLFKIANSKWRDVIATGDSKPHCYVQAHGRSVHCVRLVTTDSMSVAHRCVTSRHWPFANVDYIHSTSSTVTFMAGYTTEVKCGTNYIEYSGN